MLRVPTRTADRLAWADWLEIKALTDQDGNASRGDLAKALQTLEYGDDERCERMILNVFDELAAREKAAKEAYPFVIHFEQSLIERKPEWQEYPAYVFCLCLSYFGVNEKAGSKSKPRRWFEHLSRDAARQYLGGEGVRFGSPRVASELPVKFKMAIDKLCKHLLKEGSGFKDGGLPSRKDDAVDIVAWKHFPDELPGKLILFGNCASEQNWQGSKEKELTPRAFWEDWIMDPAGTEIVKSFFIPHRTEREHFLSHVRKAGIIFDRCRIAYWTYFTGPISKQLKEKCVFNYKPLMEWSNKQLGRVRP